MIHQINFLILHNFQVVLPDTFSMNTFQIATLCTPLSPELTVARLGVIEIEIRQDMPAS